MTTEQQRRRNRRLGWALAIAALAILAWTIIRADIYGVIG